MKVAIISGKGGSGKSSISAAFIALAKQVVAVDCDVDASNLPLVFPHETIKSERFVSGEEITIDTSRCIGCGRCAELCSFKAIRMVDGKATASNLLCEGCAFCIRLCPVQAISLQDTANSSIYTSRFDGGLLVHGDLYPGDDNSGKMIARLRTIADEEMEKRGIDLQLLDGPPGIGCPVLSTVTGADRVVIVCEPTLSGLSDLKRAFKVASSFCRDLSVIINKSDINADNRKAIATFCREQQIPVVAELPFDKQLVEAQLHCESIVTYAPECNCSRLLREAYTAICCR